MKKIAVLNMGLYRLIAMYGQKPPLEARGGGTQSVTEGITMVVNPLSRLSATALPRHAYAVTQLRCPYI